MDKDTATKHTPGPWNLTHDNCAITAHDGGTLICETTLAYWQHLAHASAQSANPAFMADRSPEVLANARLISAAPDLLAALEAVEADYMDRGDCALHTKIGTVIRNALSKAKGE